MGSVKAKKKIVNHRRGRDNDEPPLNFIREWRELAGYATQGDLAEASGVARSVISRLENRKLHFRSDLLAPLAKTLGCSQWELVAVDPTKIASIVQIEARMKVLKARCQRSK